MARAFRIENGDGYVVARYILGHQGEVKWSVVHPSMLAMQEATVEDVREAVRRGDLIEVELVGRS